MNEEKGGGRRQLEGPEVAPTATATRRPGETVAAAEAGGGPEGSQAVPCQLSRPRFPPLSGVPGWPELPVSLGRGVRSELLGAEGGGVSGGAWVGGALPC